MNTKVLSNYGIEFRVVKKFGAKTWVGAFQQEPSLVNFFICAYLEEMAINIIRDDVLIQLSNALKRQSFDEDGGGFETFLLIGETLSTFSSTNSGAGTATIPTQDVNDIFEAWVEWIAINNLEKYL